jgi:hypothetical protein
MEPILVASKYTVGSKTLEIWGESPNTTMNQSRTFGMAKTAIK